MKRQSGWLTVFLLLAALPVAGAMGAGKKAPEKAEELGTTAHDVEAVRRHMAVLANRDADPEDMRVSRDALLEVLGGGYEPELRLEIAMAIFFRVDVEYHSLLMAHLEDIRDEAENTGKEELAQKAEKFIAGLELLDEKSAE